MDTLITCFRNSVLETECPNKMTTVINNFEVRTKLPLKKTKIKNKKTQENKPANNIKSNQASSKWNPYKLFNLVHYKSFGMG